MVFRGLLRRYQEIPLKSYGGGELVLVMGDGEDVLRWRADWPRVQPNL